MQAFGSITLKKVNWQQQSQGEYVKLIIAGRNMSSGTLQPYELDWYGAQGLRIFTLLLFQFTFFGSDWDRMSSSQSQSSRNLNTD
jgi:hypothetical protein